MKEIKKIIAIALVIVLAMGLTGCLSNDEETSTTEAETTTASESTTAAETDDSAINPFDASPYCDEYGHYLNFDALSVTTLPELKGIKVAYADYKVEDSEIQEVIDGQLESATETVQNTEKAIENGDSVNIDYVGKIDGVEFDGGNSQGAGADVIIGTTKYVDDFLEQLIGHKPGETLDVEVTFPDDYGKEELNGKDAVFTVTINYITQEVTPEFTDSFVETNYGDSMGWKTTDDMWNGLMEIYRKNKILDFIDNYIISNSTVSEVPQIAKDYWREYTEWYVNYMCAYYSTDVETYYANQGVKDFEELYESMSETIAEQQNYEIVYEAAAEALEYNPTEEEVISFMDDYYGEGYYEYYKQTVPQATLLKSSISNIVLEYIYTLAEIEPVA